MAKCSACLTRTTNDISLHARPACLCAGGPPAAPWVARHPNPAPPAPPVPLPPFLGKQLLQTGLAAGRGLAAAVTPLRRGALKRIFNSGQSLGLQFPNEDLGFRYAPGATSAVLDEERGGGGGSGGGGAERLAGGGSGERAAGGGRAAAFEPSSAPGHRLPHCWLRRLDTGERVSACLAADQAAPRLFLRRCRALCCVGLEARPAAKHVVHCVTVHTLLVDR